MSTKLLLASKASSFRDLLHDYSARVPKSSPARNLSTGVQVSRLALPVFMSRCDAVLRAYAEDQARALGTASR